MISHTSAHRPRMCGSQLHGGHFRHALHDGPPRLALGLSRHRATAGSLTDRTDPTRTSGLTPGMTKTALRKMLKAELEDEMKLLSLDTQGTKQDLVERVHAYLSTEQALTLLKSEGVERNGAPAGWLFEAEGADTDLPPDIQALLEQQAQQPDVSGSNSKPLENPEGLDPLTYGQEYTPDQLEGLPKKELQSRLTLRGLAKSGTKAELAQRLHAALAEEQEAVLQDQLEAQDELQRQFEESMMSSASRVETEEQQGISQSVSDPEDDSTHEWLEDDEATYQSPEDDGELSFEDTAAAGATLGTVRDQEGNVLMGRFNRPRIMMDMFEHQGTKAAELAGEDYAAANRGAGEAAYSQGMSGEGPTFQQHSRVPLDSQDGEDSDAAIEDEDLFSTDNELEDGFSMAPDQGDGFDSDAEERLEREAELKRMLSEDQHAAGGYNSHRNYQNLSARSPDTIDEEFGVLDAIISQEPAESPSDPYPSSLSQGPRLAVSQAGPVTSQAANSLSRRVPKGQESPSQSAAAAIVASQGTSSLDFGTAKDWMASRLPEAVRLGITADQLSPEPSASLAPALEAEPSTSSTARSNLSGVAGAVDEADVGSMQPAAEQPQLPFHAQAFEPQGEQNDEAEWLAAGLAASRLDTDLLDELVESVLGEPDAPAEQAAAEQAAAEQLLSMEADTHDRLDGVLAEVSEAAVMAPEDEQLGDSAEAGTSATVRSSSVDEDQVLQSSAAAAEAPAEAYEEQTASVPDISLPEAPLHSLNTVLEAADSGAATVAQETSMTAAMPDKGSEFDELLVKAASEELTAEALEADLDTSEGSRQEIGLPEAGSDEAHEADLEASESSQQNSTLEPAPSPSSPALNQAQTDPAEAQHSSIAEEQLDSTIKQISEAVADEAATPGQQLPLDIPLANAAADAPASSTRASSGSQADASESSAADSLDVDSICLMGNQQELTALRAEMAQKQSALAALQGQVAAVGRSSEGNAAQIAALQEAMAGLQSQRLDLQRADLSGRLAVLQDIAAQASLSGAAKDDLQQQLQSMRDEMSQLEADLSTRDMEAASLSRKLAHARAKLGDPAAAPPANGIGQSSVPGAMHARLGLGKDLDFSVKHSLDSTDAKASLEDDTSLASKLKGKKENVQPGTVVAAGLVEAFKAIGGMFNRGKRAGNKAETSEHDSGK